MPVLTTLTRNKPRWLLRTIPVLPATVAMVCVLWSITAFLGAAERHAGSGSNHVEEEEALESPSASPRPAPPRKPLTAEQQKQLDEARRLNGRVYELWKAENYQAALPLAEQSLKIRQAILGEDHADTAQSLFNLGAQHYGLKDYAQAEAIWRQAYAVYDKLFGAKHKHAEMVAGSLARLRKAKQPGSRAREDSSASSRLDRSTGEGPRKTSRTSDVQKLRNGARELSTLGDQRSRSGTTIITGQELRYNVGDLETADDLNMAVTPLSSSDDWLDFLYVTLVPEGTQSPLMLIRYRCAKPGSDAQDRTQWRLAYTVETSIPKEDYPAHVLVRQYEPVTSLPESRGGYLTSTLRLKVPPMSPDNQSVVSYQARVQEVAGILGYLFQEDGSAGKEDSVSQALIGCVRGEFGKAESILSRLRTRHRQRWGEEDPAYASALNNLGCIYLLQGNLALAQTHFEKTMGLLQRPYSPGERECDRKLAGVMGLHARASVLAAGGKYDEATNLAIAARNGLAEMLPSLTARRHHHVWEVVLQDMDVLGAMQRKHFSDREPSDEELRTQWAVRAELLEMRAVRTNTPDQCDGAARDYYAALELLRKVHGPQDANQPDVIRCVNNLAFLLERRGEYRLAHRYFEWALAATRTKDSAGEGRETLRSIAVLTKKVGDMLYRQGQFREAADYYQDCLNMNRGLYPPDTFPKGHTAVVGCLNDLSAALLLHGEYDAAMQCATEAVAICKTLYVPACFPHGHYDVVDTLINVSAALFAQTRYDEARKALDRAKLKHDTLKTREPLASAGWRFLPLLRRLSKDFEFFDRLAFEERPPPNEEYPHGWPDRPMVLAQVAGVREMFGELAVAQQLYEEWIALLKTYYPPVRYPMGHVRIARAASKLARLHLLRGNYDQARQLLEESLAIRRRLYPPAQYLDGHLEVVAGLEDLAELLQWCGDDELASEHFTAAFEMRQRLYPEQRHPHGHRVLLEGLLKMAGHLAYRSEYVVAQDHYRRALRMWNAIDVHGSAATEEASAQPEALKLGPGWHMVQSAESEAKDRLATIHRGLADVLAGQGQWVQADEHAREALRIQMLRYPPSLHPKGHPELARILVQLGAVCSGRGDYGQAQDSLERARRIWEDVYPEAEYPHGCPELVECLHMLGSVFLAQGDWERALAAFQREESMRSELASLVLDGLSEAEALNFAGAYLRPPCKLMAAWTLCGNADDELYRRLWTNKGRIYQVLAGRQRVARGSGWLSTGNEYARYIEMRTMLADLAIASFDPSAAPNSSRQARLVALTSQKEQLERQLAADASNLGRWHRAQRATADDLLTKLPSHSAFIDLVRYRRFQHDPRSPAALSEETPSYVAFVLQSERAIARVELGPASAIDAAIAEWRRGIIRNREESLAHEVFRLVWEPIQKQLHPDVKLVYLSPADGLNAIPWAALPGHAPGTVLLEDYAIATVSHGQLLLEHLSPRQEVSEQPPAVLAVGAVDYMGLPQQGVPALARQTGQTPSQGNADSHWMPLPGTREELVAIDVLAATRRVNALTRSEATVTRVLTELPYAHFAHFATHGFFAEEHWQSVFQLDQSDSHRAMLNRHARYTVAGRNPLVLSGLVLAGANVRCDSGEDGLPAGDSGILTAEAIAALPLDNLALVVLSACDTGLGNVAGGEGVMGLQRAFHLAGARNVIASLWKVDDHATAVLMRLFYENLWQQRMPPQAALRDAQLTLYHNPDLLKTSPEALRAGRLDRPVPLPDRAARPPQAAKTPVRHWAAFVLSGSGQ